MVGPNEFVVLWNYPPCTNLEAKKKRNNVVHERPKRTISCSKSIDLKLNNFSFFVQAYDTLLSCQSIMAYIFIYPSICDLCFGNLLGFELKYYFRSF